MVTCHKFVHEYKKPTEKFILVWIGDVHAGNKGCDKPRFERVIEWTNAYADAWIGMGDWADAIVSSDKRRFNWKSLDKSLSTPDRQYKWIREKLRPLAPKCAGLMVGNHDYELEKYHHHDYVTELAEDLDILDFKMPYEEDDGEYTECAGFTKFIFDRTTGNHYRKLEVFSHHGRTKSTTLAGKINALRKMVEIARDADVFAMGHMHLKHEFYLPYIKTDRNMDVVEGRKYFVATGGFLKGWEKGIDNYVQKAMMTPTSLGAMFAVINPEMSRIPYIEINEIPV